MLLNLDLQMFAEGEDDNDLDLDSMLAEFEAEWEDEMEGPESEESEGQESESEPEEDGEPTTETEEELNPNDEDAEKRNRAFADLRRQAQENEKYAKFIQALASESGVTPDEILSRYQERQLQVEAEKQQVPVEFLKESRNTQSELTQLKEQLRAERMDSQINNVINKYGADDDSIRNTFESMARAGIDPRVADNVDFETFYRATNLDTIIQKEVEQARQKDLEDKKKRQDSASIGNGTSVSPSSGDYSDDAEFEAELARLGIRI